MKPDISIIVPVYEVEPYLRQCLDSLVNQTKKEIEIIVFDDGSTDNCGKIIDEYVEKDNRIKAIHQQNLGISESRNKGIDMAAADHLMFVDGDDWVKPTFCEKAFQLITEKQVDIVFFQFERIRDGKVIRRKYPKIEEGYKTRVEAVDLMFKAIGNFAWNKIYKKRLFDGIRFPKGRLYEDVAVTYRVVLKAEKVWYTNENLYYYRYRAESIVNNRSKKSRHESFEMTMQQIRALRENEETKEIGEYYLWNRYMAYCIRYEKDPSDEHYLEAETALMGLKPKIPKTYTWKLKILLVLFWYARWLFDLCCKALKQRKTVKE